MYRSSPFRSTLNTRYIIGHKNAPCVRKRQKNRKYLLPLGVGQRARRGIRKEQPLDCGINSLSGLSWMIATKKMLLSFCCQATCLPGDLSTRLAKPNVLLETRIYCEHAFAECGLTIVHGQDSSKLPGCEQQIFRRRLFGQKANLLSKAHAHFGLAIRNCCFFMVDVCGGCGRRAWRHSDAGTWCAP